MRPTPTLGPVLPAPPSSSPPPPPPPGAPPHGAPRAARRTRWGLAAVTAAGCAYVAIADPNQSSTIYPQCPFRALTGLDCPGCGITRAVRSLVTGHPLQAMDHNLLFVVALVLGAVWFGWSELARWRGVPPPRWSIGPRAMIGIGVAIGVFWVARNLPWGPLHWLDSGSGGT